jgi:hypothetical protein
MLNAGPLIAQVAGALLAGAILAAAARPLAPSSRVSYAAVALVPIAVATLVALPGVRAASADLLDQFRDSRRVPEREREVRGGIAQRVDVGFLRWVEYQLAPGDTIRMVGPVPKGPVLSTAGYREQQTAAYQWSVSELTPHVAVERFEDADWVIVYGRAAAGAYPAGLFEPPREYAPGFTIARRRAG